MKLLPAHHDKAQLALQACADEAAIPLDGSEVARVSRAPTYPGEQGAYTSIALEVMRRNTSAWHRQGPIVGFQLSAQPSSLNYASLNARVMANKDGEVNCAPLKTKLAAMVARIEAADQRVANDRAQSNARQTTLSDLVGRLSKVGIKGEKVGETRIGLSIKEATALVARLEGGQ